MKRIKGLILIFAILLLPVSVFASDGGFNLSGSTSLQKGGSGTINITTYNSAGRLLITSSNSSIVAVGQSDIFVDGSGSFSITAIGAGTATITVTGSNNYATFDSEESLQGFSRSITITVTDPNANNNNNNNNNNNGGGTNPLPVDVVTKPTNNNNNTSNNNDKKDEEKEDKKEEPKKSSNNKIKKLTIDDYELKKINDNKYTLSVENDVDMVNVKVDAEDSKATIKGIGMHELVVGENKIEITVTAEDGSKNIVTIVVTREESDDVEEETVVKTIGTDEPTEDKKSINIIAIVMTGLNVILALAVVVLFIKNRKLKMSINKIG